MKPYKSEFLELALELEVLQFGEFKLKSGRISPYFFNSGRFDSGYAVAKLGRCYAAAIADLDIEFDVLFGPAYKGIPLVVLAAAVLAERHDRDYPFAFNRKEAKDHGEGGSFIGAPVAGKKVLIVDDVITAGTSVRESVELIRAQGAAPAGVLIALDRMERGQGSASAVQEVREKFGIPVVAIATLDDVMSFIAGRPELARWRGEVAAYRAEYGVVPA
jgi:orotate phosphoribosyltransferase